MLSTKFSFVALVFSGILALPAFAAPTNAAPFGLELGVASCDQAKSKVGRVKESKLGDSDILLTVTEPAALYEGASTAVVRCSGGKVIAIQLEISKGGVGNTASREVYANLSQKYKRVAGGAMPQVGNGYARFQVGNSVIEQDAPHMSFEFTVTYYEKSFYDSLVESNKQKEKNANDKKQSSL